MDSSISVILPVYNGEMYLRESLDSINAQSLAPCEIIVIDDGSTDDSAQIAQSYAGVTLIQQANGGAAAARNRGIEAGTGQFVACLDADDLACPQRLQKQAEAFSRDSRLDLCFTHLDEFISPELTESERSELSCKSEPVPGVCIGTMMVRRDSFLRVGLLDGSLRVAYFMKWYGLAMESGLCIDMLPEVLVRRRLHKNNSGTARKGTACRRIRQGSRRKTRPATEQAVNQASPAHYRFLPSPQQELLVRAAVEQDDAIALAAWAEWKANIDLETIDTGSARILPLAYVNLRDKASNDDTMKLARGAYKKAWYRNLLLFREASQSIAKLQDAGIECLVFKGAAIATRYYMNPGLRPMDDLDLAVPYSHALDALGVLESDGWSMKDLPHQRGEPSDMLQYCHGFDLAKSPERFIDLHWHLISLSRTPDADVLFWQGSEAVEFVGRQVLMPNITDSLLITCFHGCRQMFSGETSTLRWCVDAIELLRVGGIDWHRLAQAAESHGIGESVSIALSYLRETFAADVPAAALSALRSGKVPFSRRHYLHCVMRYADPENMESVPRESEPAGKSRIGFRSVRRLAASYRRVARTTYNALFAALRRRSGRGDPRWPQSKKHLSARCSISSMVEVHGRAPANDVDRTRGEDRETPDRFPVQALEGRGLHTSVL